jgi:hypothetical protein
MRVSFQWSIPAKKTQLGCNPGTAFRLGNIGWITWPLADIAPNRKI